MKTRSTKVRWLAGLLGAGLMLAPLVSAETASKKSAMSEDMRQAIAFQQHKDQADARQARMEKAHPSVTNSNADRSADRDDDQQGKRVKDPEPKQQRQDKR